MVMLTGHQRTKRELRRALQDIGWPQLGQLIGATISGRPYTALRAYLGPS